MFLLISYSIDILVILMYNGIFEQNIFYTFSLKKLLNLANYSYFYKKNVFLVLHFSLTHLILKSFYNFIYILTLDCQWKFWIKIFKMVLCVGFNMLLKWYHIVFTYHFLKHVRVMDYVQQVCIMM